MADWFFWNAWALLLALLLDAVLGEPDWLYKRVSHPVVLMGKLVSRLDERLNLEIYLPEERRAKGRAALAQVLLLTGIPVAALWGAFSFIHPALGFFFGVFVGTVLLAQRSLFDHVEDVRVALKDGDLEQSRRALSMIVGRETSQLDEEGMARAALESLAENHSDGVIAPAFWMLLGGPVGITLYKAINTADSMIGYKTKRYVDFGRAAAKVDDWVNWIPARLSALLVWLGVFLARVTRRGEELSYPNLGKVRRDASTHVSPNAGWPEAAYAYALDIALGGPRTYATGTIDAPYLNEAGEMELIADDIREALFLFKCTCAATMLCVFVVILL